MLEHAEVLQIQNDLANLTQHIERMQWELGQLLQETQESNGQLQALTRHFLDTESHNWLNEVLAEVQTQMESGQEKIDEMVQTMKKLSRTQFKANTLNEAKDQQLSETIALLREMLAKREETQNARKDEEQQRQAALQSRARVQLAADFLPVLDGIELALEHGTPASEQDPQPFEQPQPASGFFRKLFSGKHRPDHEQHQTPQSVASEVFDAIAGWLHGLEIVRERFLRLLEQENIRRIPDLNELFDPHLHVALEVEERADVPENTVVKVLRKGYTHQDRVLRYAEVIVAKTPQQKENQ